MPAQIVAHVSVYEAEKLKASVYAGEGVTWLYLKFADHTDVRNCIAVHDLSADYMHRIAAAINAVPVEAPRAITKLTAEQYARMVQAERAEFERTA